MSRMTTIFIIIFMLPTIIQADNYDTFEVRYSFKSYSIKVNQDRLQFNSSDLNITIDKEKCNQHILERFNGILTSFQLKKKSREYNEDKKMTRVNYNGQKLAFSNNQNISKFFKSIPAQFRQMQIESKIICKK